jgi:hypothetical protein
LEDEKNKVDDTNLDEDLDVKETKSKKDVTFDIELDPWAVWRESFGERAKRLFPDASERKNQENVEKMNQLLFSVEYVNSIGSKNQNETLQIFPKVHPYPLVMGTQSRFAYDKLHYPQSHGDFCNRFTHRYGSLLPLDEERNPLLYHAGKILIAGGSMVDLFTSSTSHYHKRMANKVDLDFFIVAQGSDEANTIARNILVYLQQKANNVLFVRSRYAITCICYMDDDIFVCQIILRCYRTFEQILSGFDIDASCIGFDGQRVYTTERFRRCMKACSILVHPERQSASYWTRLYKYTRKGFALEMPGLNIFRFVTVNDIDFSSCQGLVKFFLPVFQSQFRFQSSNRIVQYRHLSRNLFSVQALKGSLDNPFFFLKKYHRKNQIDSSRAPFWKLQTNIRETVPSSFQLNSTSSFVDRLSSFQKTSSKELHQQLYREVLPLLRYKNEANVHDYDLHQQDTGLFRFHTNNYFFVSYLSMDSSFSNYLYKSAYSLMRDTALSSFLPSSSSSSSSSSFLPSSSSSSSSSSSFSSSSSSSSVCFSLDETVQEQKKQFTPEATLSFPLFWKEPFSFRNRSPENGYVSPNERIATYVTELLERMVRDNPLLNKFNEDQQFHFVLSYFTHYIKPLKVQEIWTNHLQDVFQLPNKTTPFFTWYNNTHFKEVPKISALLNCQVVGIPTIPEWIIDDPTTQKTASFHPENDYDVWFRDLYRVSNLSTSSSKNVFSS